MKSSFSLSFLFYLEILITQWALRVIKVDTCPESFWDLQSIHHKSVTIVYNYSLYTHIACLLCTSTIVLDCSVIYTIKLR